MKLSDIIKNDNDRLFIVDTECFIIFTGGSIHDDRPFIRIGTWVDLPVEIIPLVENIIISDRILGNPAIEQFNINVRNLSINRYIGGESILKRFLDYQRNFGLDLTNVSVVNIEKDIPELPDKKNISDRDQFIGVFYSDGNVKIVHDGNNIFDLNSVYNENLNITELMGRIAQNSRNTTRYSGAGFAISDKNPVFYSDSYFTSYQFPGTYAEDFSLLEIDPGRIRELILPSHNVIHVSDIMKFRHMREGKIRIFSDNRDQTELIRRLFKGATVHDEPFSGMNYSTGNGMTITSHGETPNIRVSWSTDQRRPKPVSLNFIKSPSDIKTILKEDSDAIVISYTAYEQSVLLFKSVQKPVMILNDGNPNIRKISETDNLILSNNLQYDIKKYDSAEEMKKTIGTDPAFSDWTTAGDTEAIEAWLDRHIADSDDYHVLFNSISLIKITLAETKDRKLFSSLRSLIQKYSTRVSKLEPDNFRKESFIEIALCSGSAFQIARKITRKSESLFTSTYDINTPEIKSIDPDQHKLALRIIEDRERLRKVLTLFYEDKQSHPSFQFMKSELNLLKEEIDSRREIYSTDYYDAEPYSRRKKGKSGVLGFLSESGVPASEDGEISGAKKTKFIAVAAILLILIIVAGLTLNHFRKKELPVLSEADLKKNVRNQNIVITVKRVDEQEKQLLINHNVRITDYDIFRYANDVAVRNGYSSLTLSGLKEKNPHWIYPSNVFIMLDGEKVVVQKGDTLWDLAHAKLEKMNAEFYKITDQLEKVDPKDKGKVKSLLEQAEKYIYTAQQKKYIENYKSQNMKNE